MNTAVLDVVIGLVFIFLLYSLLASIIHETIAMNLAFRAKVLEKAIARMLDDGVADSSPLGERMKGYGQLLRNTNYLKDKKFTSSFFGHPLIKYLSEDKWYSKPSYLEKENFSKVIIDLLHGVDVDLHGKSVSRIKESLATGQLKLDQFAALPDVQPSKSPLPANLDINPQTQKFLQSLLGDAQGDLVKFKVSLENWFDATMERASGWYKRYTQFGLFLVGFVIAIAFNVDTVAIVNKLSKDPVARQKIVAAATQYVEAETKKNPPTEAAAINPDSIISKQAELMRKADTLIHREIGSVNTTLGLGWTRGFWVFDKEQSNCVVIFIGWFLTAMALSLGAPFWFDLLSKLVKIRGTLSKQVPTETVGPNGTNAQQVITINNNQTGEEAVG